MSDSTTKNVLSLFLFLFFNMKTEAKKGLGNNLPNTVKGRGWMQILSGWQENHLFAYHTKCIYSYGLMRTSGILYDFGIDYLLSEQNWKSTRRLY